MRCNPTLRIRIQASGCLAGTTAAAADQYPQRIAGKVANCYDDNGQVESSLR